MRIGLFFGTYNPVHTGHLIIANYMVEYTDIDQLWFIISPHNPLKDKKTLLNKKQRLYMVNVAVEDNYKLLTSRVEFDLPQPSYTIDTLTYLKEQHPDHSFVLIMGSDNLETLPRWKNYEVLLDNYDIYVYNRAGSDNALKDHSHVKFFDVHLINISASYLRNAIKEGRSVRYLIPDKALQYIEDLGLYK
ncbi:MAG: nicotinate-nucleotide adenylyltransferase [Bacteroidetes bacterium]|nr:nicotinate-nucleotide adenylyltransferase [Bacteroidota bacterium]